jgi:hypothetical protein
MRKPMLMTLGCLALACFAVAPLATAHEEHHAECDETTMNALKADIQAMQEGEAKATATKEMNMAQEMMAKNDMEACNSHMHSAMEATEK